MPRQVSPTDAIGAEIDELFGSGREIGEVLAEVMRLSARLVLQQVLEDEVRSTSSPPASDGSRRTSPAPPPEPIIPAGSVTII